MKSFTVHNLLITLACIISFSFLSCTTAEYIKTGMEYEPLPPDTEVKVLLTVDKSNFDEIGIADIGGVSLPVRIEKAKQIALNKGGNVIVPVGICDEEAQKRIRSGYIIQSFYILKSKDLVSVSKTTEVPQTTTEEVTEEPFPEKQSATFTQLLQQYPFLQGKTFSNEMQPLKFYKIPPSLTVYGLSNYKLCLMQFDKENSVLVFIPSNKIPVIKKLIESPKSISVDYTPLGVYKDKYPVLQMLP